MISSQNFQVDFILNMWCSMFAYNWTMGIGMKRGHYSAILNTFPFSHTFWAFKVVFFWSNPCQGLPPTLGARSGITWWKQKKKKCEKWSEGNTKRWKWSEVKYKIGESEVRWNTTQKKKKSEKMKWSEMWKRRWKVKWNKAKKGESKDSSKVMKNNPWPNCNP